MLGNRAGVLILGPFCGQRIKLTFFFLKKAAILIQVNGQNCSTKSPLLAFFSRSCLLLEDLSQEPCSRRTFPRSPAPILRMWLEGKGTWDIKPRGSQEHPVLLLLQYYIRRKKEDFHLLLTGPSYTPFCYLLSQIPVSQVLKNHTRN